MRGTQEKLKKKKKNNSLDILELNPTFGGGGGGGGGGGKSNSRERKSNFYLDFPAFRPSVRVKPSSKVVLPCKGYAWTSIL